MNLIILILQKGHLISLCVAENNNKIGALGHGSRTGSLIKTF